MSSDSHFMQEALELAEQGVGRTAPNPPVGAVLVKDNQIIGRGFHPAAGQPHAEIFALRDAGALSRGADLYVTLEPCCHQGRTGPCTEAVISAGVRRVFVGVVDPNPQVAGQGIACLQQAGIEVVSGVLEDDCKRLIAPFTKQMATGLPYVIYKSAMTLDGQTTTSTGESQWISSPESRTVVHQLRDRVDAIMVGSGTVLADNPRLTTRLPEGGRNPQRIVLDGGLVTPVEAAVYDPQSEPGCSLVTGCRHTEDALKPYRDVGVTIIQVEEVDGHLDLRAAMEVLGQKNLQTILLEGGSILAGAMLRANLVDRLMFFLAPLLLGGHDGRVPFRGSGVEQLSAAHRLHDVRVSRIAGDILVEGEVTACSPD